MANINFPENRITELVRKTIDEYNAEIMRGWTKEERKKLIPIFLPDYRGYGFRTYSYDPFWGLDQLDIDNPECVNHDLYKMLRRFKRGKCGTGLGEREALSTFNNAYAYTLDALNHSHPETRYNEYFEKYYFFHADVEVIRPSSTFCSRAKGTDSLTRVCCWRNWSTATGKAQYGILPRRLAYPSLPLPPGMRVTVRSRTQMLLHKSRVPSHVPSL